MKIYRRERRWRLLSANKRPENRQVARRDATPPAGHPKQKETPAGEVENAIYYATTKAITRAVKKVPKDSTTAKNISFDGGGVGGFPRVGRGGGGKKPAERRMRSKNLENNDIFVGGEWNDTITD